MTTTIPAMREIADSLRASRWSDAVALAEATLAASVHLNDALLWRALGDAYSGLKQYEQAIDAYSHARKLAPEDDAIARVELLRSQRVVRAKMRCLMMLHDFDLAREAQGAENETSATCLDRIVALYELDRYDEALAFTREFTARRDAEASHWALRGRLVRIVGRGSEAAHELAQVVTEIQRLAPDDPVAQAVCAELLRSRSAPDQLPPWLEERGFNQQLVDGVEVIAPPVRTIPAGTFLMGSTREGDSQAYPDEAPRHELYLPTFAIGQYPVTVAEYARFVHAGYPAPERWLAQLAELDHPVTHLTWRDANAYAAWLSECTGQIWRLPTEAEWEKAARWDDERQVARIYPWGDTFDHSRCVSDAASTGMPLAIGSLPRNISYYGVMDMAGNVWEYTSSLYKPYAYLANDGREAGDALDDRVARGGSCNVRPRMARAACRGHRGPIDYGEALGVRLVQV